jgi:hypothetical protein
VAVSLSALALTLAPLHAQSVPLDDSPTGPKYAVTPSALLKEISRRGAKVVLSEIYDNEGAWKKATDGISGGAPGWLQVAVKLKPVSDAGASEELDISVAEALERAPKDVLALLGDVFDAEGICGNPESVGEDPAVAVRTISKRQKAVAGVVDASLQVKKAKCESLLEELKVHFSRPGRNQ